MDGNTLRELRTAAGLTAAEVATAAGYKNSSTLCEFERRGWRDVPPQSAEKITEAIDRLEREKRAAEVERLTECAEFMTRQVETMRESCLQAVSKMRDVIAVLPAVLDADTDAPHVGADYIRAVDILDKAIKAMRHYLEGA